MTYNNIIIIPEGINDRKYYSSNSFSRSANISVLCADISR